MVSDLYLRRTAARTGRATVTHHFVWDAARFVESQQRAQREVNAKKPDDAQAIEVATQADYRAFAWPRS